MAERQLAYDDTFTQYVEGVIIEDTTGDSPGNEAVLSSTRQPFVLMLTSQEYVDMFSALLTGTDLLYGAVGQQIQWNLWKAAKVDNSFCQLVADCINDETSPAYTAFNDWLVDQMANNAAVQEILDGIGTTGTTPITATYATMIADCDLDNLFGFCRQLVKYMHGLILDLYEVLEVLTNQVEFIASVSPKVTALTISLSYLEFMQDAQIENYLANYTQGYEDELACELFCLAQEEVGCTLTWELITDYFAQRSFTSINQTSLLTVLNYIAGGVWSGTQFCDVAFLTLSFILRMGGDWAGTTLKIIQQSMLTFLNDPDSDWTVLCDCNPCPAWDFTIDNGGWATFQPTPAGVYVPGTGWREGTYGSVRLLTISRSFDPTTITSMEYDLDVTWGTTGFAWDWVIQLLYQGSEVAAERYNLQPGEIPFAAGVQTRTIVYSGLVDEIKTFLRTCSGSVQCAQNPGDIIISAVRLNCP